MEEVVLLLLQTRCPSMAAWIELRTSKWSICHVVWVNLKLWKRLNVHTLNN
ncbi:hypothetical protein Mapa_006792 [Marchantia paleacea]|nr:hypothetical protein Mapa_006792 [Marchantia paleacea]